MRASGLKVERRGLNKGVLSIRTELERVDKTEQLQIVNVRRRQERSAQTRQRILEGGAVEFATKGFGGATTRSIAKRANVPHGLIIYHFKTKLGVWEAVMKDIISSCHTELMGKVMQFVGRDDVAALRMFQRLFIEMSANRPELNWLMSREIGDGSKRLSRLIEKVAGKDIDLFIDLIRVAQRLGRYVEGDPAHLHYLFVGAASRAFMVSSEIERTMSLSPFDKQFIKNHIQLCERLFFRDPPASGAGQRRTDKSADRS